MTPAMGISARLSLVVQCPPVVGSNVALALSLVLRVPCSMDQSHLPRAILIRTLIQVGAYLPLQTTSVSDVKLRRSTTERAIRMVKCHYFACLAF